MFGFLKKKLRAAIGKVSKAIKKKEKKVEEVKPAKPGLLKKLKEKITTVKLSEDAFNDIFSQLELVLIESNVALQAIDSIKEKLKTDLVGKPLLRKEVEERIKQALKGAISKLLLAPPTLIDLIKKAERPFIIAFFGINGSGKTTTIAKICYLLQKNKLSCVFAASDTFRAASIEQLQQHADKLGVKVIKHTYGADPAAVAYDAIAYAKAKSIDVVLIDTAGRMHTQANLMAEMEKICRVAKPNLRLFVGEAVIGNDAVEQARRFAEAVGIDGIILAKADVDEKGGAAVSVSYVTSKPILFLGVGQSYLDLEPFKPQQLIEKLGL